MGQAKKRGTFEERRANAKQRKPEPKHHNSTPVPEPIRPYEITRQIRHGRIGLIMGATLSAALAFTSFRSKP